LDWSIPKRAFATALLPNVFSALLLGDLKSFVNARGGIFLHAGQNVAVKIERSALREWPDRSIARMAQIMEPDARQGRSDSRSLPKPQIGRRYIIPFSKVAEPSGLAFGCFSFIRSKPARNPSTYAS
jgi:hypothetical protein